MFGMRKTSFSRLNLSVFLGEQKTWRFRDAKVVFPKCNNHLSTEPRVILSGDAKDILSGNARDILLGVNIL